MSEAIHTEEPEQLTLLRPAACVRRYGEREAKHDATCAPASAEGFQGEPLERPLRQKSLTVLHVVHAASLRREIVTTSVVRLRLGLPSTPGATRNVERLLKNLAEKKGVLESPKTIPKGVGRPPRVWRLTPAGIAELLTDHAQACAEDHNRAASARKKARK